MSPSDRTGRASRAAVVALHATLATIACEGRDERVAPTDAGAADGGSGAVDASVVPVTTTITPPGESWWDPEVLRVGDAAALTWQTSDGEIWLADLSLDTGLPLPGTARRLGTGAAPLLETYNGPELALDARGLAVVYTSVASDGTYQVVRVAADGLAERRLTDGPTHFSPLPTRVPTAPSTRLVALRRPPTWGTVLWLDDATPEVVHALGHLDAREDGDARWVDGSFVLVTTAHPDHRGAVAVVDTTTGVVTRALEPAAPAETPYGWRAPEAGGALTVLAVVGGEEIVVRRARDGTWSDVWRLASPERTHPNLGSPEPFVVGDRSYVSFAAATHPEPRPGSTDQRIWIASVDPSRPTATRCDDGAPGPVTRVDPEVLVGPAHVFVYAYTITAGRAVVAVCALPRRALEEGT